MLISLLPSIQGQGLQNDSTVSVPEPLLGQERGRSSTWGSQGRGGSHSPPAQGEPAEKPSGAALTGAERNAPLPSLSERRNSTGGSASERESWDPFAAGD